jgi:hypothetical protein
VVGEHDLDDSGDSFSLRYPALEMVYEAADGLQVVRAGVPIVGPVEDEPVTISVRLAAREMTYRLGDHLSFPLEELGEILFAAHLMVQNLVGRINEEVHRRLGKPLSPASGAEGGSG